MYSMYKQGIHFVFFKIILKTQKILMYTYDTLFTKKSLIYSRNILYITIISLPLHTL